MLYGVGMQVMIHPSYQKFLQGTMCEYLAQEQPLLYLVIFHISIISQGVLTFSLQVQSYAAQTSRRYKLMSQFVF